MPRLDPDSGCTVMTTMEMFHSIAQEEGKTTSDVIGEFHNDIQSENDRLEQQYKENAEQMVKKLEEEWLVQECLEDDGSLHFTDQVLEVLRVRCSGWYSTSSKMLLRVLCTDGDHRYLVYSEFHVPSTYIDPPDDGEEIEYYDSLEDAEKAYEAR